MPCDSGIITEIPVAHCFSNCCIRLHVPYWLVNSFLMFSPFLSLTKASPNSAPCSRPVQAAVFALLTSFVFQRLCWGNRRCGEKFISSNPSHQNCTTQSMRYGLIIFISHNCWFIVSKPRPLCNGYRRTDVFELHSPQIGHNNNHAEADRDWKDLFELFSGVCYDISQKFLAAVNSASRIPMLKDVLWDCS